MVGLIKKDAVKRGNAFHRHIPRFFTVYAADRGIIVNMIGADMFRMVYTSVVKEGTIIWFNIYFNI